MENRDANKGKVLIALLCDSRTGMGLVSSESLIRVMNICDSRMGQGSDCVSGEFL